MNMIIFVIDGGRIREIEPKDINLWRSSPLFPCKVIMVKEIGGELLMIAELMKEIMK